MKRCLVGIGKGLLYVTWTLWAIAVFLFHYGTLTPPKIIPATLSGDGQFIKRTADHQIQHLLLTGDPYTRGLKAGGLTRDLLFRQETDLLGVFQKVFRNKIFVYGFELVLIPIFKGIENVIPPAFMLEMYGVSRATDPQFDTYIDAYTRQLAYHGLHEVGQMMVDQIQDDRFADMGCTVVAAPLGKSWLIGRTFDFEGSRILDEEKIMKWVFPESGFSYVSVIWAGMVGAVTAVNEKGLYMSLNAANSEQFDRKGLPSTLLLTKVIQSASSADEALYILQNTPMMITEIFVLVDSKAGKAFRIEKSPTHTAVIPLTEASAVTNHLIDEFWKNDRVNTFRRESLTSVFRAERAEQLVQRLKSPTETDFLKILRDKKALDDQPLSLGNRRAINSLIANHGVIYNGDTQTLYVSRGPHLNQAFEGFDLTASFAQKKPVYGKTLPADDEISAEQARDHSNFEFVLKVARKNLLSNNNEVFANAIKEAEKLILRDSRLENSQFYDLQAQFALKTGDIRQAKVWAQKALDLKPAYKSDRDRLEEMLK